MKSCKTGSLVLMLILPLLLCSCTETVKVDGHESIRLRQALSELIEMPLPEDMEVEGYVINGGESFYFEFEAEYPHDKFKSFISTLTEPPVRDYVGRYTVQGSFTLIFLEHRGDKETVRFRNYRKSLDYSGLCP